MRLQSTRNSQVTDPAVKTVWRAARHLRSAQVPECLWSWLLDPASLTQRLTGICGSFRVRVLRQAWQRPLADEARALGLRTGACALVREVHLFCDDVPWVFARTVIPLATLHGKYRRLSKLRNRSLGAVLFADKSMRRSAVEIAFIDPKQRLFHSATRGFTEPPDHAWGRRSLFYLADKRLLLSEIFLHDMPSCGK